jgi:hypothetical protein
MASKLYTFLSSGINDRKRTELFGEIETVKEQLFLQILKYDESNMPKWIGKSSELLEDARLKAQDDMDMGWRLLKIARRLLVEGYTKDQCNLGRLDTGTQNSIKALFPLDDQGNLNIDLLNGWDENALRFNLSNALQINDWYFDNEYLKMNKSRINLRRALFLFWAGSSAFPFIYLALTKLLHMEPFMGDWKNFFFIGIYGWIGSAFSIVTRITTADQQGGKSLPDSMQDGENLIFRSLIGPGAAMLMYMFIQSGIINPNIFYLQQNSVPAITQNISIALPETTQNVTATLPIPEGSDSTGVGNTNQPESNPQPDQEVANKPTVSSTTTTADTSQMSYLIMVLAFLAGFSERLVIQILEKLTDKVDTIS